MDTKNLVVDTRLKLYDGDICVMDEYIADILDAIEDNPDVASLSIAIGLERSRVRLKLKTLEDYIGEPILNNRGRLSDKSHQLLRAYKKLESKIPTEVVIAVKPKHHLHTWTAEEERWIAEHPEARPREIADRFKVSYDSAKHKRANILNKMK